MATSVVCDNTAVREFELLKLSGNAEIDGGETGRVGPVEGCLCAHNENTHCHNPSTRKWKFMTFQLTLFSLSQYREKFSY